MSWNSCVRCMVFSTIVRELHTKNLPTPPVGNLATRSLDDFEWNLYTKSGAIQSHIELQSDRLFRLESLDTFATDTFAPHPPEQFQQKRPYTDFPPQPP